MKAERLAIGGSISVGHHSPAIVDHVIDGLTIFAIGVVLSVMVLAFFGG